MRLNGNGKEWVGSDCEKIEPLVVGSPEAGGVGPRIRSIVAAVGCAVFVAGCGGKFHYLGGGGGDGVEVSSGGLNSEEECNEALRRELLEKREKLINIIRLLDERVEWARLVIEGVDKAQKLANRSGRKIEDAEDIKMRIEGWIEIYKDLRETAGERLEKVEEEM